MEKAKPEPLSDYEWTCLWAAQFYFLGRGTIAACMFPGDIVKNAYHRLSLSQKKALQQEITRYSDDVMRQDDATPEMKNWHEMQKRDLQPWLKLAVFLDPENHHTLTLTDDSQVDCFYFGNRWFPVADYLRNPSVDTYVPNENIKIEGNNAVPPRARGEFCCAPGKRDLSDLNTKELPLANTMMPSPIDSFWLS